jgi:hypothetical protein
MFRWQLLIFKVMPSDLEFIDSASATENNAI